MMVCGYRSITNVFPVVAVLQKNQQHVSTSINVDGHIIPTGDVKTLINNQIFPPLEELLKNIKPYCAPSYCTPSFLLALTQHNSFP